MNRAIILYVSTFSVSTQCACWIVTCIGASNKDVASICISCRSICDELIIVTLRLDLALLLTSPSGWCGARTWPPKMICVTYRISRSSASTFVKFKPVFILSSPICCAKHIMKVPTSSMKVFDRSEYWISWILTSSYIYNFKIINSFSNSGCWLRVLS